MSRVIDLHNHLVAPEVVRFLERAGARYNTRIIEQEGRRFFVIQDTARRPLHAKMTQVEARARELERAAQLGLRGVEIPPHVQGQGLDESPFEVFWEAAEALRLVVCIHPFEAAPQGMLARYNLENLVGNLYDTGLAAALLIYGGVFERHPALRVVLYHADGAFPSLLGRLDNGYRLAPECQQAIPRPPSTYVEQSG